MTLRVACGFAAGLSLCTLPLLQFLFANPDSLQVLLVVEDVADYEQALGRQADEEDIPRVGRDQVQVDARGEGPHEDRGVDEQKDVHGLLAVKEPEHEHARGHAPHEQLPDVGLAGKLQVYVKSGEDEPDLTAQKNLRKDLLTDSAAPALPRAFLRVRLRDLRNRYVENLA